MSLLTTIRLHLLHPGSVRPRRCVLPVAVALSALLVLPSNSDAQALRTTVAAPDGTGLATDVYFPIFAGLGPWPTVLQRTPYGKSGLVETCLAFNLFGYACVAQDERGTGESEGHYSAYLDERGDGQATLAWIAAQSWCDGKIGTFGASALGMTQYAMSPGAPAALSCMVPIVATPDFYNHAAFQGGALRYALAYNWLHRQDADDVFQQLLDHRLWGPFWESWAVLPQVASIDVPALHIGGWYDIFSQGTLDGFAFMQRDGGARARGNQKLIVGPWTHSSVGQSSSGQLVYPDNAIIADELPGLLEAWFDRWLKQEPNQVDSWPAVRVYLMGAAGEPDAPGNRWLDMSVWPPPARAVSLYLEATGTLAVDAASPGSLELLSDPDDPVPTLGGANLHPDLVVDGRPMGAGPFDQRPVEARNDVAVFSTGQLETPVTVMGRISVRLWVRPDTPDLDLAVRLCDVYPDGRSMLVTDSIQRARTRCGTDRECFLSPGTPSQIVVDLWSTALVFNAGHRIRISVSGSNAPRFEVNPNHGGAFDSGAPTVVARPELLFGPATPSALVLPVVEPPRARRRSAQRR